MPRFKKPETSKKTVPFQREVPPPSPPAGTPKGVNPMSVLQTLGPETFGNIEGGFGTVAEYAKGLDNVKSKSALKDRRAILEKILVGSPEQSVALGATPKPSYGGSDPLSRSLAPIFNTISGYGQKASQLAGTNVGELMAAGGVDRLLRGKGSAMDIINIPLTYTGAAKAAGLLGSLPKGTIPKILQGAGLYGAASIDPKTRKVLQKYVGTPASAVWDVINTPMADLLP